MQPNVIILRAPGTNCDEETAHAFELAGASAQRVHVNQLVERPGRLDKFQILCVPGGFSYGDDLGAGRILASRMRHRLADWLHQFRDDGKLVLGICNGFQVLMQTGLLFPVGDDTPPATLTWNDRGRFEDRWVRLAAVPGECVFLQGLDSLELPIAHAEGKFYTRDEQALRQLSKSGQLALRYCSENVSSTGPPADVLPYPDNPNGSIANVAGMCDTTARVFGLMPHPERYVGRTQHPRWTRGDAGDLGDGLAIFANAVRFFQ